MAKWIRVIGCCLAALALAVSAFAQERAFYIEELLATSAPPGQRAPGGTIKTWVRGDRMRTESSSGEIAIYRPDLGVAWLVHSPSKTYVEIGSDKLAQMGMQSLSVFGRVENGVFVIPEPLFVATGKKRDVGAWHCEDYEVAAKQVLGPGITSTTTQCVAAKAGLTAADLVHVFRLSVGGATSATFDKFYAQVQLLPGYPVEQKTVTNAQGQIVSTTKTLKKIEFPTVNDALFELPGGFTKIQPPPGLK